MTKAGAHAIDLWGNMVNPSGKQHGGGLVGFLVAAQAEAPLPRPGLQYFVRDKLNTTSFGLLPAAFQQFVPGNALGKSQVVLYLWFPPRHRLSRVDDESHALGPAQINGGRKPGNTPANNDGVPFFGLVMELRAQECDGLATSRLKLASQRSRDLIEHLADLGAGLEV